MADVYALSTNLVDGANNSITAGTLAFIAEKNDNTVLKGTSVTVTPGSSINLVSNTYKVYYTGTDGSKKSVGTIAMPTAAADRAVLLDEVP